MAERNGASGYGSPVGVTTKAPITMIVVIGCKFIIRLLYRLNLGW